MLTDPFSHLKDKRLPTLKFLTGSAPHTVLAHSYNKLDSTVVRRSGVSALNSSMKVFAMTHSKAPHLIFIFEIAFTSEMA